MALVYSHNGEVHILIDKYIKYVWETYQKAQDKTGIGFTTVRKKRSTYQMMAAPNNLFDYTEECEKLSEWQREVFHSCAAKALYFAKRSRPDILPSVVFLSKSQVAVECYHRGGQLPYKPLVLMFQYVRMPML